MEPEANYGSCVWQFLRPSDIFEEISLYQLKTVPHQCDYGCRIAGFENRLRLYRSGWLQVTKQVERHISARPKIQY